MSGRAGELVRRIVQGIAGGMTVALAASVFETIWARNVAPAGGVPSFSSALPITFGLVAPLALTVSTLVSAFVAWLSPHHPASITKWKGQLRSFGAGRPADVAAFAPLGVFAAFVWMTASAHLARSVLALPITPGLAGLAVASGALAIGLASAVVALASVPPLRRALARMSDARPSSLDPVTTGAFAFAVAVGLFAIGVTTGTVSGEGGVLGIYGIFKRPELDLRAPVELLAIAIGAVVAPSFARPPITLSRTSLAAVFLLAVAPLYLFVRDAKVLNRETVLTQAIERGAPLGKIVLGPARKATDHDHDGVSGSFGGGDCDDANSAVNPLAEEILDDGIDQDCSGADLTRSSVERLAPSNGGPAAEVDHDLVPKDLNLVLITVDTLRADLGFAGYARKITPNIDQLAARSTVFDRAYSLASYTGKSVGPLLIGKYGSETNRNWGHFNKFNDKDTFVTERLQRAGIRTLAVHGHRYFDVGSGLERGFDVSDFSAAPPKDAAWDVDARATSAELSNAAIALLEKPENTKGRFFLWVHYLDPHADYVRHDGIDFGSDARALYDGEVAFTDQHVGRLLDAIAKSPFAGRTAVVLTSDHGETFGEHGMFRHGFEVWEPLVHVPLLIQIPGAKPHHVHARRSAVDLVPTIIDLMRLPKPSGDGTDFVSGVSLLGDLFPAPGAPEAERDVFVDMPAGPYNDARRALIHGDTKLVVSGESRFDLFDLAADPGEEKNLADDAARLREMKDRYAALKTRLHEVKVTGARK